jgi:hypothetical protein
MNQRRSNSCIWSASVIQTPAGCKARAHDRLPRNPDLLPRYSINSPHFWTVASPGPHGMIGTDEVEFLGEPSISLSE